MYSRVKILLCATEPYANIRKKRKKRKEKKRKRRILKYETPSSASGYEAVCDIMYLLNKWESRLENIWLEVMARGPSTARSMCPDRQPSILSYDQFGDKFAGSFNTRGRTAFSGSACANAYGPHTGLSSMVLQRKRLQGRTGHMIN